MKRSWKKVVAVALSFTGLSGLMGGCSTVATCNNDACYDRKLSSTDPYQQGDVAAWGSEKKIKEDEEAKERMRFSTPKMLRD